MIRNPHQGLATEPGWSMGFAWGFNGPGSSVPPPLVIAPDLVDAFDEGTLVGQQAAIDGLIINGPCISLDVEPQPGPEVVMEGVHLFEIGELAVDAIKLARGIGHLSHLGAGAFVAAFLLMIPAVPPPESPETALPRLVINVREQLSQLGLDSGTLCFGVGIEMNSSGCELLLTPIFRTLDSARQATIALNRPHWVLALWDTTMSSSFTLVENSG
jgi:hypothetical protein